MSRRFWTMVVAAGLSGLYPLASMAQDQGKPSRQPLWSVGAGVGFSSVIVIGAGGGLGCPAAGQADDYIDGYGCIGWIPSSPEGHVVVERRLGDSFALMLELSLGHMEVETRTEDRTWDFEGTSVGTVAGLRWIFNPGGLVEVSTYVALSGSWRWGESSALNRPPTGSSSWSKFDQYGYDVSLSVGLVLERELLESLYLRLSSSLAYLRYDWYESRSDNARGTGSLYTSNGLSGGLDFRPAIYLRLAF